MPSPASGSTRSAWARAAQASLPLPWPLVEKIYYTSEEGNVFVVQAGPKFKVLAQNELDEVCMATPAISENALYFHTQGHLVGIA